MKTLIKRLPALLCMLTLSLVVCTSCEWQEDDEAARWNMTGTWEVIGVSGRNSPYRNGDTFVFYDNGDFQTWGYDDYHEEGQWDIQGDGWNNYSLLISFDGYNAHIIADLSDFPSRNYISLRVDDANYGEYFLRIARKR